MRTICFLVCRRQDYLAPKISQRQMRPGTARSPHDAWCRIGAQKTPVMFIEHIWLLWQSGFGTLQNNKKCSSQVTQWFLFFQSFEIWLSALVADNLQIDVRGLIWLPLLLVRGGKSAGMLLFLVLKLHSDPFETIFSFNVFLEDW